MDVEVTGLRELVHDLDMAGLKAVGAAEGIVAKGALNVKKDWQRRWSGHAHAPALPAAVGYDLYHLPGAVEARIGPDKNMPQGALGNIYEFGTPRNAPIPGGLPALESEAPKFERALSEAAGKLLGE